MILINVPQSELRELKAEISKASLGEIEDLNAHVEYQDINQIIKLFEIKDLERNMDNGFLGAVYSRLALKKI